MESKQRPLQAKSLRVFVERNQGLKGMRLSMSPYREQDWLANYPLYSVSAIFGYESSSQGCGPQTCELLILFCKSGI